MSSPSIVAQVGRAYVLGIALAAASIVVASTLVGSIVVVSQDDAAAIALGRTLAIELAEPAESEAAREVFIRTELAEQHNFARRIEVWRRGERLGTDGTRDALARFEPNDDAECVVAIVDAVRARVCVVRAGTGESIVLSRPLTPMLASMLPLALTVAIVALIVTLLFAWLGRRMITESIAPIARFEAEVAALSVRETSRSLAKRWGFAELDSLASTFEALLARIDEARRRETRFVSDAAHELRTPLTRLRAQLELAREELRDGRAIDARLDAASKTAIELGTTTEALLAMARDETGKTEPVELDEIIDAVLSRLDDAPRARVHAEGEGHAITDGVAPLIELAVANLLDNALKYSSGEVHMRVDARAEQVSVTVEDDGPGIDDDELARVREPFVRGARAEGIRGAGIGLALVDHVARMHGGSLALENRTPRGLRASIALRAWRE